jgi:hypothetical protein
MSMQSAMANDLSELFVRDMPTVCKIGSKKFNVLLDDLLNDEVEGFGGAESLEMQRVHFKTTDLKKIEVGSKLHVEKKTKIVLSSITSADGNELIVTVRAD